MHDDDYMIDDRGWRCNCPSFVGLTWTELRDLGSGCSRSGVCPVLDKYRAAVMKKVTEAQRAEEDLRLAKEMGLR